MIGDIDDMGEWFRPEKEILAEVEKLNPIHPEAAQGKGDSFHSGNRVIAPMRAVEVALRQWADASETNAHGGVSIQSVCQ